MVKIVYTEKEANCITHSGTMHADEVFATAFLELYLGEVLVYRTTNVKMDEVSSNTLVYDIGRGKYDHHQPDRELRENGIPYSSIGLLWKSFGKTFLEQAGYKYVDEMFDAIDKDLIEGIDADDNGVFPKIEASYKVKTLPGIIKIFNPSFASDEEESSQFIKAVEIAKSILKEEILYINGKVEADKLVKEILDKVNDEDKYLILDEYLPYEETLLNSDKNNLLFVAFPSNRGGFAIKTIPKSLEDRSARCLFPIEWAGLEGKELEEVADIKGLRFCHVGRFIVSCSSLDTVMLVLHKLCQDV